MTVSVIKQWSKASYRWKSGRFVLENVSDWRTANTVVVFDVFWHQSRDNVPAEVRHETTLGSGDVCNGCAGLRRC
jgi:hypothetical protein